MHTTRLALPLALALLLAVTSTPAYAQHTVFLVRHAERADAGGAMPGMMADDPDLSRQGRARADSLVTLLKDAGIRTIITTEYKRTQQTAAPLAKALGIRPTVIPAKDVGALTAAVKSASGHVLVVGHSNTVPAVVKGLAAGEEVAIGEQDYDNLLIVVLDGTPTLLRLHY
jgi:broad specificity phosphatase PhoE